MSVRTICVVLTMTAGCLLRVPATVGAAEGSQATLKLDPPRRNPPTKLILHLDGWSGRVGSIELPVGEPIEEQIPLSR